MRSFIAIIIVGMMGHAAQAADVVCSCSGETKCSDIKIKFVPSNPGVYMNIEYAYGARNQEGFATITTDTENRQVTYKLGNFLLVEKNGKYELPQKLARCN